MVDKKHFGAVEFGLRFGFALLLVSLTYNASGYSYLHWLLSVFPQLSPLFVLCSVLLIIGWVIFIRATITSLGSLGLVLLCALIAALIWLFVDIGWLSLTNFSVFSWIVVIGLSFILAVGMSWSHIRRRISGQYSVDDIEG